MYFETSKVFERENTERENIKDIETRLRMTRIDEQKIENMTFADKSRYDRTFQQVKHKGRESTINYIKIFHNAQALSVSLGKSYSEDQIMHTFLDNFHQSGKYSAQLASHQAELRRE